MTKLARLVEYKHTSAIGRTFNSGLSLATDFLGSEDNREGGISIKDINKNVALTPVGTGVIDVVNDFDWNANYINASYAKIPKLFITEREQQESSMVSAYYYYISNILNIGSRTSTSGNVASSVDYLVTQAQTFIDKAAKSLDGVTSGIQMPETPDAIKSGTDKFVKFIQAVGADFSTLAAADSVLLGEYLKSYTGIYLTRETGFNYVLPYFSNDWMTINNGWSKYGDGGSFGLDAIDQIADTALQLVKPGVFIERPQYFNFQQNGDSVTVTFPLLNTVSESYKQNYELLWVLGFQNKYYRESFASIRPPKIYTLTIPGVKFMPYAHIENMDVKFAGTRRLLEVETPAGPVMAPVPDAYIVSITFKSLLSDSANNMLTNQFHRGITTGFRNSR